MVYHQIFKNSNKLKLQDTWEDPEQLGYGAPDS